MWKLSHITVNEVVEPFKLHHTYMSYIYKVFEHLKQLRMGIWQHIYTITTTDVSPVAAKNSGENGDTHGARSLFVRSFVVSENVSKVAYELS